MTVRILVKGVGSANSGGPATLSAHHSDAIIIGGGHNGLVCAFYLARGRAEGDGARAPRRGRRRGGDRGIPSRLPQLGGQLHGLPAEPQGHRATWTCRRTACASSSGRLVQLPADRRTARYLASAAGAHAGRGRQVLERATPSGSDAYYASGWRIADVLRELVLETPPNVVEGGWCRGAAGSCCGRRASARSLRRLDMTMRRDLLRPVRDIGRRLSGWLVRERADQGGVRLRRHRRQLRQPLHAGHGLRAAAPCVRRGERQEGRLGPRDRRHGRDHPGHGARPATARASRSAPTRRCARCWSRTAAPWASSPTAGEAIRARARRLQRQSEAAVPSSWSTRPTCRPTSASASSASAAARARSA